METVNKVVKTVYRNEIIRKIGIALIAVMIGIASQTLYKSYEHKRNFEPHINEYKGLSISIATTAMSNELYVNYLRPNTTLAVVLTNRSTNPITLWKDWCSWGYYNLSFEITDQLGKKYTLNKVETAWTRNYPDQVVIKPQESLVFNVNLGAETWINKPVLTNGEKATLRIKAIYENQDYDSSSIGMRRLENGNNLWVGKVVSKEYICVFYN